MAVGKQGLVDKYGCVIGGVLSAVVDPQLRPIFQGNLNGVLAVGGGRRQGVGEGGGPAGQCCEGDAVHQSTPSHVVVMSCIVAAPSSDRGVVIAHLAAEVAVLHRALAGVVQSIVVAHLVEHALVVVIVGFLAEQPNVTSQVTVVAVEIDSVRDTLGSAQTQAAAESVRVLRVNHNHVRVGVELIAECFQLVPHSILDVVQGIYITPSLPAVRTDVQYSGMHNVARGREGQLVVGARAPVVLHAHTQRRLLSVEPHILQCRRLRSLRAAYTDCYSDTFHHSCFGEDSRSAGSACHCKANVRWSNRPLPFVGSAYGHFHS